MTSYLAWLMVDPDRKIASTLLENGTDHQRPENQHPSDAAVKNVHRNQGQILSLGKGTTKFMVRVSKGETWKIRNDGSRQMKGSRPKACK